MEQPFWLVHYIRRHRHSDILDQLGSWHLVQLCSKDGLWAEVKEQRKCFPQTQLLPTMPVMRAGWSQCTDAVQCCAHTQELEGLLRAEV